MGLCVGSRCYAKLDGKEMTKTLKSRYQTNPPLKVGHLVTYKDPLPETQDLLGVVLRLREIESNGFERGYLEADVHWTARRWGDRFTSPLSQSPFETHEDASRLKILS